MIMALHLRKNNKLKEKCVSIYNHIREELPKGTKYRSMYKLAPAVIFLFFKLQNFQFELKAFVDNLDFDKEEFIKRIRREIRRLLSLRKLNPLVSFLDWE